MCSRRPGFYALRMSSTEYSRKHRVPMDDEDRNELARLVMAEIQYASTWLNKIDDAGADLTKLKARLARLRSLLERLTD